MHLKLKRVVVAMAVAGIGLGLSATAEAGRVVLTGHDNDLHAFFGSPGGDETTTTAAELTYVRAGSTLPVLVIDNGLQAVSLIGNIIGAANVVSRTVSAVTAADFDPSLYSAFVVASVQTCGGCDNPVGTGTTLAGFSSAISDFFNAGRGILGETVATDTAGYAYVPQAAGAPSPIGDSDGFVATAAGTAAMPGFLAVNGDQTHNIFSEPGSGGVSVPIKSPSGSRPRVRR